MINKSNFILDEKNQYLAKNNNKYIIRLPIPEHRSDVAEWYEENTCIEYLFSDEVLTKMGVTLIRKKGNTYNTIKDIDNQKKKIQQQVTILNQEDFLPFKKLFEIIAAIIGFKL